MNQPQRFSDFAAATAFTRCGAAAWEKVEGSASDSTICFPAAEGWLVRRLSPRRSLRLMGEDAASAAVRQPTYDDNAARIILAAFSERDFQQSPVEELRRQILGFRLFSPLSYREALARRLDAIISWAAADGEPLDDTPESLRYALRFLGQNRWLDLPVATLTPSGTIRFEWTKSASEHLALNFLPTGRVRLVVFSAQRISGESPSAGLTELLSSLGVGRWAGRRDRSSYSQL